MEFNAFTWQGLIIELKQSLLWSKQTFRKPVHTCQNSDSLAETLQRIGFPGSQKGETLKIAGLESKGEDTGSYFLNTAVD